MSVSPQLGRLALQSAVWIVLVATGLLFFLDKGSAEYVLTVFSLVAGLLFGITVWFLTRRAMH
jgi:hypothetical protein